MNTEDKKVAVEILKRAKTVLSANASEINDPDKEKFICYAIANCSHGKQIRVGQLLRNMIMERLEARGCLEYWLYKKKGIPESVSPEYLTRIQQTRHAWVDSLIQELSA